MSKRTRFGRQKDSFFLSVERFEELALHIVEGGLKVKQHGLKATNVGGGVSKVEKIRIGLLVGGYSIPAIPTQSTENEGRVEGVSKLSYSKKKSQSPDFHKPGLCYV